MAAEAPSSDAPKPDSADTADAPSPPVPTAPKPESPPPPPDPDAAPPQPAPASAAGSFSQLLAGAMAPPVIAVPMVAVPCFITPASMLESPTFTGQFAISHQAVLATVTAQAQMQLQAAQPSSSEVLRQSVLQSTISPVPLQQMPPPGYGVSVCTPRAEQTLSSDREPHSARSALKINHDDGYNWRKYGQKQVKSGVNSRSYYKCTSADCSAKKKVEQCPDGRVTEVSYRGQHSHDPPQQTRYSRERVVRSTGVLGDNESSEFLIESNESGTSMSKTEHQSGNETTEQQLFCSSDCEGDAALKTEEDLGDEPDPKRRPSESTMHFSSPVIKTFREPRVVVQSASDAGRVSDGYRWRKYGQKTVKGNPNPRSYYRCTYNGCPVRKHVERASDDEKSILISYEGKHNHDLPGPKNNSDPPASPLIASAMTVTSGEQIPSSQSLPEQKPELGGEKAPESALAAVSIGHNSSAGEDRPSLLNENSAAVPVENA